MRIAAVDRIEPAPLFDRLPIVFEQASSRLPAFALLLATAAAMAGLLVPFGLLAALAAQRPEVLLSAPASPASLLQLALGLVLALVLVAVPLCRGLGRLTQSRRVQIASGGVRVEERGFFGVEAWEEPLASFRGVAQHVRTSLSGPRHEIVLVHARSGKSVLLAIGGSAGEVGAERVARLLEVPVLPVGEVDRTGALPEPVPHAALRSAPGRPAESPPTFPQGLLRPSPR